MPTGPELTIEEGPFTVTFTKSAGSDGAALIMIDSDIEPDGSDGFGGLRVLLNDEPIYNKIPYEGVEDAQG